MKGLEAMKNLKEKPIPPAVSALPYDDELTTGDINACHIHGKFV